ncbi:MAG: SAM-dependent methyltransferase, partial [Pseudomonadota bacterium]
PMQFYDEDIVTLMRKLVRTAGSSYLEETKLAASAWEEIGKREFRRLWDGEADSLPKMTTTRLYLVTGLLLPIWKEILSGNERIYRVTPEGYPSMIGRTVSEDGAAALRARFMVGSPKSVEDMLIAVRGSTKPVDLGRGLSLVRRRVAGDVRFEIEGADRGTIDSLKAAGCFTEIIAFQLRVFLPHGDGVDSAGILRRITGASCAQADRAA